LKRFSLAIPSTRPRLSPLLSLDADYDVPKPPRWLCPLLLYDKEALSTVARPWRLSCLTEFTDSGASGNATHHFLSDFWLTDEVQRGGKRGKRLRVASCSPSVCVGSTCLTPSSETQGRWPLAPKQSWVPARFTTKFDMERNRPRTTRT
jgi:hypothetical protein